MSYDPDYSPFPEREMAALAFWHEQAAAVWKVDSNMHREHLRRAADCRNAVAAHIALRERFLEQSMELRAEKARVA